MSSRTWQMLAAAISVAIMIVVLVKYELRDETAPTPRTGDLYGGVEPSKHEGGQPAPIQVYADAKLHEWRAYRVNNESSLTPPTQATVLASISEVGETTVNRRAKGRVDATGEIRVERDRVRPREGLTIDQLTGNDIGGWTIYDLVITDEDHTVGGRTFKCKKLSYASDDPLIASKRTRTELWISAEVPVGGMVEEREVQEMPSMRFVITKQLIGFGDASGTTWGTKPEGL